MINEILDRKINIISFLAFFVVLFSFSLFYALLFKDVKNESRDVILFVLGAVSTNLTQVVSYFFGSSHGADEKTKIIKDNITIMNEREKENGKNNQ
jgi:predicted permease